MPYKQTRSNKQSQNKMAKHAIDDVEADCDVMITIETTTQDIDNPLYTLKLHKSMLSKASSVIGDMLTLTHANQITLKAPTEKKAHALHHIINHVYKATKEFNDAIAIADMADMLCKFQFSKGMRAYVRHYLEKKRYKDALSMVDIVYESTGIELMGYDTLEADDDADTIHTTRESWPKLINEFWDASIKTPMSNDDDVEFMLRETNFRSIVENIKFSALHNAIERRKGQQNPRPCQDLDAVMIYRWFQEHNTYNVYLAACVDVCLLTPPARAWWLRYLRQRDPEYVIQMMAEQIISPRAYEFDTFIVKGTVETTKGALKGAMSGEGEVSLNIMNIPGISSLRISIYDIDQSLMKDSCPCASEVDRLFKGQFHVKGTLKMSGPNQGKSTKTKTMYYRSEMMPYVDGQGAYIDEEWLTALVQNKKLSQSDKITFEYDLNITFEPHDPTSFDYKTDAKPQRPMTLLSDNESHDEIDEYYDESDNDESDNDEGSDDDE
jgi:hypothetical protein